MRRRDFLRKLLMGSAGLAAAGRMEWEGEAMATTTIPTRALGKTGFSPTLFSLGGEGVLRTTGRMQEAQRVISAALDLGVRYMDTAPAYQQSQDYHGATLGTRRDQIFLASKTHERSKAGSLALLEDSLRRLRTDRLDLWQLHDLRSSGELEEIFGPGGAIEAVEAAKRSGKIRFAGITGHTDPAVLLQAMERYPFDTVLLPVNVADKKRLSFIEEVIPVALAKGMGVIGMKVMHAGDLFGGTVEAAQAMRYALSQPVSTVIVGCSSPQEVQANAASAKAFSPMGPGELAALEARVMPGAGRFNLFKKQAWGMPGF